MKTRRRALVVTALAVALLGVVGGEALADHEYDYTPTTTRYFMSNDATGCPGTPFLATTAGSAEPGCGYVGGAPFGELYHAGAPVASTIKTYTTREGTAYLDPTRDVSGNVTVVATATTNRMAAGQIRVDVTLRARTETGQDVVLGTHTSETMVNPTNSAETNFPFAMTLDDVLDKVRLDQISISVDIRGWHILTGYHRLNGQSFFDLPAYIRTVRPH